MEAVLEDAYILISEKKISNMKDLLPVLERSRGRPKPLAHHRRGRRGRGARDARRQQAPRHCSSVAAVKAPGFGDRRKEMLKDIAILTGGQVISEDLGLKLENVTLRTSASAKRVTIDKDNTTIIDGAGDPRTDQGPRRARSASRSRRRRATTTRRSSRSASRSSRAASPSSRSAPHTETEMKEKKARVEDALHATRAAVEEGIVAGGGVALLRARRGARRRSRSPEERAGSASQIVRRALEEPLRQIAQNAGLEGSVVVDKVREGKGDFGYNAATDTVRGPAQGRASSTRPRSSARRSRTRRASPASC